MWDRSEVWICGGNFGYFVEEVGFGTKGIGFGPHIGESHIHSHTNHSREDLIAN